MRRRPRQTAIPRRPHETSMNDQQEPAAEAMITQTARDGWEFFEHANDPAKGEAARRAASEKGARAAAIAAALWNIPEFRELLEFLLDASLRRATFTAQMGLDPMQAYSFGVFREGQNAMIYAILKLIAQGRKIEPPKGRDA